MSWSIPSAGGPCPSFAVVIPIVGGELAYMVDDSAPAIVCDEGPIVVVDGNAMPSNFTLISSGTSIWNKFNTLGLHDGSHDVDFVYTANTSNPVIANSVIPVCITEQAESP